MQNIVSRVSLNDSNLRNNNNGSFNDNNSREKFLSSHKELQEAKMKLEELRLLRFEEKSSLKQEIEQLNEKYGEEERNSCNLERQLKKLTADKVCHLNLERQLKKLTADKVCHLKV